MSTEIAIIGAGLVGPILAILLCARPKFKVNIYEARKDPRIPENNAGGRSFDLALSKRGLDALHAAGLMKSFLTGNSVPVYSRMIHEVNGTTAIWRYGKEGDCLHSVERRRLNNMVLDEAERRGISIHFEHKLVGCQVHEGVLEFEVGEGKEGKEVKADFIFGCDGAYSVVRREGVLQDRKIRVNYEQHYINHGYKEIHVPPTSTNDFALSPDHLHLWPRKEFMFMGLPNPDKSITMTLFMPFEMFDSLKTGRDVVKFFQEHFSDAIDKIGGEKLLVEEYFKNNNKPGKMVSVTCHPHLSGKALLLGDAAHAMVPFYGQGVNAGLEDCLVFCQHLDDSGNDVFEAATRYAAHRWRDSDAIVSLSLYNYDEMRELVMNRTFWMKKKLDTFLHATFPSKFTPLYSMVAFTRLPYSEVIRIHCRQSNTINKLLLFVLMLAIASCVYMLSFGPCPAAFNFSVGVRFSFSVVFILWVYSYLSNKLSFQWNY